MKSSRIRSFSGLYSVQIHQEKFEYGYFLRSKGDMYGIPKLFQNYLVGKVWQDQLKHGKTCKVKRTRKQSELLKNLLSWIRIYNLGQNKVKK